MKPETARKYAYRALPHLVRQANLPDTIYFGQLAPKIGLNPQGLGDTLDYIRDEVCKPQDLPHLNIIVVRDDAAEMPPDEVIVRSGMLPGEMHAAAFERLKGEVFTYEDRDDLLAELGIKP